MKADGELIEVSPSVHPELFYGVVGGYGALGIIIEAELDLAENVRVERDEMKLKSNQYLSFFKENVRHNESAVFHNADLYPPHYTRLRAVTWTKTDHLITEAYRLMPLQNPTLSIVTSIGLSPKHIPVNGDASLSLSLFSIQKESTLAQL